MSDNPRFPGHPSDMPSSRSGGSQQSGGQQPINYPPSYPPPPIQQSNHQARNIILGAVATVITSTIIYYLTVYQNSNKNSSNHLEIKEATVEAWKSYKAYENAYAGNLLSLENTLVETGELDAYQSGMHTESKKFSNDLDDLSKGKLIDRDLVKAFKRRLDNEGTFIKKADEYFKNITAILQSSGNPQERKEKYVAEEINWNRFYKGTYERSINDVREIAKTLAERYGVPFSLDDFILVAKYPERQRRNDSILNVLQNTDIDSNGNIVQKTFAKNLAVKDIEGTWNVDGDVVVLERNSKLDWTMQEGDKATGSWTIVHDLLKVDATTASSGQKINWSFRISNLTRNSFTITQVESPYQQYEVTRIK